MKDDIIQMIHEPSRYLKHDSMEQDKEAMNKKLIKELTRWNEEIQMSITFYKSTWTKN